MFDRKFIKGDEGAISPDFAVIAVMLVGLGIAVTSTIGGGTADLADNVEDSTSVNSITIVAQADDDTEYPDGDVVGGGEPTDDWNGYPDDPVTEEPPVDEPPAEDPPAEDPPAEEPPAEDPPAEEPPAEEPPVEEDPYDNCILPNGKLKNNCP